MILSTVCLHCVCIVNSSLRHCTRLLKNTSLTNLIELNLNWKPDRHNSTVPLKYVNSGLLIKRDISSQRHSLRCFVQVPSPCCLLKRPIVCRRFCKHRVHLHSVTQGPLQGKTGPEMK